MGARLFNFSKFNLDTWKLTLPTDITGGTLARAVDIKTISSLDTSKFFHIGFDGGLVFRAAVDGARTVGTKYARSELREMKGAHH